MSKRVPKRLLAAALRRIRDGVPELDIEASRPVRERIERVAYILRRREKEPELDVLAELKSLAAGRYATRSEEWKAAQRDMSLYEAVTGNWPPSTYRHVEITEVEKNAGLDISGITK